MRSLRAFAAFLQIGGPVPAMRGLPTEADAKAVERRACEERQARGE